MRKPINSSLLAGSALSLILISGTGAAFAQEQNGETGSVQLGTIVVDGSDEKNQDIGSSTENPYAPLNNYIAQSTASGGRVPLPLAETPRSISVISSSQMDDQSAVTLDEAISYTAGVTSEVYGADARYNSYSIRGFQAQIGGNYRDGMRLQTYGWAGWQPEIFGLERVEVLKGPTSDIFGANQPGGLINMVSKRPLDTFSATFLGSIASHKTKQIAADISGPTHEGSPIKYRLVGVFKDGNTQTDNVEDDRLYFAPSVSIDLSDKTKLTILGQLQEDTLGEAYQLLPYAGTLGYNSAGDFGPETFAGDESRNKIKARQNTIGYELDHAFDNGLKIHQRARYAAHDLDYDGAFSAGAISSSVLLATLGQPVIPDPTAFDSIILTKFDVDQTSSQYSIDTALEYDLETENITTKFVGGLDFYKASSDADFAYGYLGERNLINGLHSQYLPLLAPYLTPQQAALLSPHTPGYNNQRSRQIGLYGVAKTKIMDRFIIDANIRQDWVNTKVRSFDPQTLTLTDTESDDSEFTGRIAVAYKSEWGVTPYASYGTSFNVPPAGIDQSGNPLKPETARQFEIGVKYEPTSFNARFNAALFEITKENAVTVDPANPTALYRLQTGEERVRGLELEASVELAKGLTALASYTYLDAEVTKDSSYQGNKIARIPEHSGSLWVKYAFQSQPLEGLSVAAGLRHLGSRFTDSANAIKLDAVTLLDGSISYTKGSMTLSLAGRNLANKEYINSCSGALAAGLPGVSPHNCTYAQGRDIRLQLKTTF